MELLQPDAAMNSEKNQLLHNWGCADMQEEKPLGKKICMP